MSTLRLGDSFKAFEDIIFETLDNDKESIIRGVTTHLKANIAKEKRLSTLRKFFKKSKKISGDPQITQNQQWKNWAQNIVFTPKYTAYPTDLDGLKFCVKKAVNEGLRIRCATEGHTWSTLSMTNSFLLVLKDNLSQITAEQLSNGDWVVNAEAGAQVSVIDQFLRKHNPPLTIESMTVLDNVRIGGVVATGSHGAKSESRTIVDQVVRLEIVDASGELREFSDEINPEEMAAARVNLGLLGVIYRVSLRVKPMYNLRMKDTFPKLTTFTKENLKSLVEESDGLEIFYWPFNSSDKSTDTSNDKLWIKRWTKSKDAPSLDPLEVTLYRAAQKASTNLGNDFYRLLIKEPTWTPFVTHAASLIRLKERDMVWEAPDAIHYQAGIDNIPCQDMEFAIKIDEDFGNVIEELNFIAELVYKYQKDNKFPLNLTAELRILKSSNALLSAAYDENPNTYYFFPEVLSVNDTEHYKEFCIELAQRWISKYRARPHWAKSWEDIPGIKDYLRDSLGERIKKFENVRKKYDPNKIFFDNDTLRQVFYGST